MNIFVLFFSILLQEKLTQCQPGDFGHGTKGVRLPDDAVCKDIGKDKCTKVVIENLCPQMCSGSKFKNSAMDSSLSKLMEPVLKATENTKLVLKEAKKINQILDNIEEDIKHRKSTKPTSTPANHIRATSCADPKLLKEREHGLTRTRIFPFGYKRHHFNQQHHASDIGVDVLCDQDGYGGGWTVIQMRRDVYPRENFHRDWHEYVKGFGQLDGEFWIGLDVIYALTNQAENEIHIYLEDWEGSKRWARYSTFRVGPESESYKLTISGVSGDAGDSMKYHNNRKFYTKDRDINNCAKSRSMGGWWYNHCEQVNLNGQPDRAKSTANQRGINWYHWRGHNYSLKTVTMKIRPRHSYG